MGNEQLNLWIDLRKNELESVEKSLLVENKNRIRYELLLILFCIVSIIYISPANDTDINKLIEIPAISLKVSLQTAVLLFPTFIATIYLMLLNSSIKQVRLKIISVRKYVELKKVLKNFEIPLVSCQLCKVG